MVEEKHHHHLFHHHKDENKRLANSCLLGGSDVFVEEGIYSETTTGSYGNGGMGGYTTTALAAIEEIPNYEKEAREHKHHEHLVAAGASASVKMEAVLEMPEVAQELPFENSSLDELDTSGNQIPRDMQSAKKASMGHSPHGEVGIDIELPNVNGGDPTAINDPILQANPTTEQWGKVAELVLGISASAGYNSSSIFPKAANAAGFIASLTAISLRHTAGRAATRILAKFAAIACGAGTLAAIVKDLPDEYIWVAGVVFLIPATVVAFA